MSNFFQRTQIQTARPTIPTNTSSKQPVSQTPLAVYPTNQPIMKPMAPTPFPSLRAAQLKNLGARRPPPRKIIMGLSLHDDVQLKKSENAWKPGMKRESLPAEPESNKTQDLFKKVRSILNKLTPEKFSQLVKQVWDLTIDTEERLKGVIDLVFEKAIDEPSFSVAYGKMCRCLATLKVPITDAPNNTVNFQKLLLSRCQKEFEKDKVDDVVFERKQKELDSAASTERDRLQVELQEAKDIARRRSISNIKFIGELFKLKMLTEAIMHDCVVKLLGNHDEASLECLCRLLTTIGKDFDLVEAKPRMDHYFKQMEKIIREGKTSSRTRFMLQDTIDLRLHKWVSRRANQGPKTIDQIHKEAKLEEEEEQRKVQQQLYFKDTRRRPEQREQRDQREQREQRDPQVQGEETWKTVPMRKNGRTIDPNKIPKISEMDEKIQLGPHGSRSRTEKKCSNKPLISAPKVTEVESEPERSRVREPVKPEPVQTREKPARSEEEIERKCKSIIDEFLHLKDFKEAVQCVVELDLGSQSHIFIRVGVESTLERSQITRDHLGQLLFQLAQKGILPKPQFYKGFADTLEQADDMAIDVPHIWLYLAELLSPVLKEGGFSMRELFSELSKHLLPVGRAGILISEILLILCKQMGHRTVASLWEESGLNWTDLLPEKEDVQAFISQQKLQFLQPQSPSVSEHKPEPEGSSVREPDDAPNMQALNSLAESETELETAAVEPSLMPPASLQAQASSPAYREASSETLPADTTPQQNPDIEARTTLGSRTGRKRRKNRKRSAKPLSSAPSQPDLYTRGSSSKELLESPTPEGPPRDKDAPNRQANPPEAANSSERPSAKEPASSHLSSVEELKPSLVPPQTLNTDKPLLDAPGTLAALSGAAPTALNSLADRTGRKRRKNRKRSAKPLSSAPSQPDLYTRGSSSKEPTPEEPPRDSEPEGAVPRRPNVSEHKPEPEGSSVSSPVYREAASETLPSDTTPQQDQDFEAKCVKTLCFYSSSSSDLSVSQENLTESHLSSSPYLRALMTAVCKAAVKNNTNCRVHTALIQKRLPVLLQYRNSESERQLHALQELQSLIVALDHPPNLLKIFFECMYDENAFCKSGTRKDPANQLDKGVALKTVTAFFTWLQEAESEDN
ncbi:eukaryotic translation initiation factor 4 gamma 3-like [Pleuronectes platessa]|uniref:eukaryotic translation initiation factor 4 gamma 3-like n=1 Tax=Pleuronectes platessa TaxID=8262 RepID=UPI00232A2467|nr:eukaryotic translation initiation factor 4 gamma 3-like [Pleuronectes platessa]